MDLKFLLFLFLTQCRIPITADWPKVVRDWARRMTAGSETRKSEVSELLEVISNIMQTKFHVIRLKCSAIASFPEATVTD